MGNTILVFDSYKNTQNILLTEPLTIVEGYGNHVGALRLTTNRQRSILVARHRARQTALSSVLTRQCVICSTPTLVQRSCPEERVFCDKCTLLVGWD